MKIGVLTDCFKLPIREGIRQIFLMSGTWLMTEPYWEALAAQRERLEALAAETK